MKCLWFFSLALCACNTFSDAIDAPFDFDVGHEDQNRSDAANNLIVQPEDTGTDDVQNDDSTNNDAQNIRNEEGVFELNLDVPVGCDQATDTVYSKAGTFKLHYFSLSQMGATFGAEVNRNMETFELSHEGQTSTPQVTPGPTWIRTVGTTSGLGFAFMNCDSGSIRYGDSFSNYSSGAQLNFAICPTMGNFSVANFANRNSDTPESNVIPVWATNQLLHVPTDAFELDDTIIKVQGTSGNTALITTGTHNSAISRIVDLSRGVDKLNRAPLRCDRTPGRLSVRNRKASGDQSGS